MTLAKHKTATSLYADSRPPAPMGSMVFTGMAVLAQMEHAIKRERINNSISKRREAGKDLRGRPRGITDSQIRNGLRLVMKFAPTPTQILSHASEASRSSLTSPAAMRSAVRR
jgi:DNA invertase Pin-like site-specific DNA recombinase